MHGAHPFPCADIQIVHEHVQPVIHKETVQPHVIHTTVPVHETHHAAAQHHGTSMLPAKTLDEFTSGGGILDGKGSAHHGEYDGCPRPYNKSLQQEATEADQDMHQHSHIGHHHGNNTTNGTTGTSGINGTRTAAGYDNDLNTSGRSGLGQTSSNANATGVDGTATGKKPKLMDRLNPKKDTDGDGKAGIMD